MLNILVIAKHPVYYSVPIYRCLESDSRFNSRVLYLDDISLRRVFFKEFDDFYRPEYDHLSGYSSEFCTNISKLLAGNSSLDSFFSHINPGIFIHIWKSNANYVLVHGYEKLSWWLVLLATVLSGKELVFRMEATDKPSSRQTTLSIVRRFIRDMMLRVYLLPCDKILYSCGGNKAHLRRFAKTGSRFCFFPCAVDNEYHEKRYSDFSQARQEESRTSLEIYGEDFVIIFPARFTSRKRPFDLVDAVSKVRDKRIVILFVGDGPLRVELERRCRKESIRAIFTGFVQPMDMYRYYSISNLYVNSSEYDPSPKAMNEAMNYYMPIITSDMVGTATDLVDPEKNGYIYKCGDVCSLSSYISWLVQNRGAAKQMGHKSKEIVRNWNYKRGVNNLYDALSLEQ